MLPSRSLVSLLAVGLVLAGCARSQVAAAVGQLELPAVAEPSPRPLPVADALWAGAAKLDITPMPGLPLGGHSIEGGIGYGVWTRLWARAIYLEDGEGQPLVLVACDLWSIPAGLTDAVVERLHSHHGLTTIGRAQLLLAATHTHHSPANYSSSRLYNRAAATKMGFDPALHDFLTRQIAHAIASAASSKAPARLHLEHAPVPELARNRSTAPFAENPEAAGILAANARLPTCPDAPADAEAPGVDPCQAIDPTLTVLRLDDLDGRPLALAGFFAVHATSMVNATDVYNGDLFAVATARAEAALAQAHARAPGPGSGSARLGDPVVALFNGPEGDVSPHWMSQGRGDALTLGGRLGDAIVATAGLDHAPARGRLIAGELDNRFTWVPLADQTLRAGPNAGAHTSKRALPGKSLLGGAEDGRTRFFARTPEGQTVERSRRAGQGPKRPAIAPAVYALVFPKSTIPSQAPLSVHRIGPLILAGLPGEFTTVMGMRIRVALAAGQDPTAPRPILVGLAGEYLSYFTTPEEYALQHYEGASMMWGQYAGSWIAERIVGLALGADPVEPAGPVHRPGLARDLALPGPGAAWVLGKLDARLAEQLELGPPDAIPRLEFETAAPSWSTPIWPTMTVEIAEIVDGDDHWIPYTRDGVRVDERGTELLTTPVTIGRERWRFAIAWIASPREPGPERFRLRAFGPDGHEHCSAEFVAGERPSPDPIACQRAHGDPVEAREGLGVVPAHSAAYGGPQPRSR
jgi:neutral ceramidase